MRRVLVAGGAGGVGEAIVRALLDAGDVEVLATSRSAERLNALAASLEPRLRPRLSRIVGEAGSFEGAARIVAEVEARGGADVAIALLGRGFWSSGPLLSLDPREWNAVLDEMLTAHFAFARAAIPMLAARRDSLYLSIGGGAAFTPVPDAALMSIAAAGQLMLTRALAAEGGEASPRICELVIDGPVRTRDSADFAEESWIGADEVARSVVEIAFGAAPPTVVVIGGRDRAARVRPPGYSGRENAL